MVEGALLGHSEGVPLGRGCLDLHEVITALLPLTWEGPQREAGLVVRSVQHSIQSVAPGPRPPHTHVIEVLPEGLHPSAQLLPALRPGVVRHLLAAVPVGDGQALRLVLSFAV